MEARRTDDTVGIAILAERVFGLAARPIGDLYFVNEFDHASPARTPGNLLSSLLNRVLRNFRILTLRFVAGRDQKVMRLPLRNFAAAELDELRDICVDSIDRPDFAHCLDRVLARFRRREHPKRKSGSFGDRYLIDDRRRHFRLGHERHARAETAPPHTLLCLLRNRHRFGRSFDHEQHYNVSMDGAVMDGSYPDCHGQQKPGEGRGHLNMFTSDFF